MDSPRGSRRLSKSFPRQRRSVWSLLRNVDLPGAAELERLSGIAPYTVEGKREDVSRRPVPLWELWGVLLSTARQLGTISS